MLCTTASSLLIASSMLSSLLPAITHTHLRAEDNNQNVKEENKPNHFYIIPPFKNFYRVKYEDILFPITRALKITLCILSVQGHSHIQIPCDTEYQICTRSIPSKYFHRVKNSAGSLCWCHLTALTNLQALLLSPEYILSSCSLVKM